MYRHVLISHSDTTRASLNVWKTSRPLFGEFIEVYCSRTYGLRRYELGREDLTTGEALPIGSPTGPSMVLIDEQGSELWLSGCLAGYMGEGPSATGYILRAEAFEPRHINLVPYADHLHLRKGIEAPLTFVECDEKRDYGSTLFGHIEQLEAQGYFKGIQAA